ncbi:unnamed protein product, partial [Rotaria sordida]
LSNNCRTFVEYLIDQIPEFHDSIPRRDGSILEYYHAQAKNEHPGALLRILHMELPKLDNDNDVRIIETRL